ncbi:MAG: EAL domain-containing protein [Vicinamibacteria bacterium]
MRSDTTAKAIVRSTFGLAHSLGMRVVAEGVEDDDTWATLAGLNCELIQGYTLSRPLPRRPAALADRARPRRGAEADQRYLRWLKSPSCRHAGREHRADVEDQRDRPLRVRER